MPDINLRRLWYHIKYRYPTREIITIAGVALVILWFIVGSVQAMQKNYRLRGGVEGRRQASELLELEVKTLEYEQRYLQSEEYQKLAVRQRLGYGDPGERVLILPPNSPETTQYDTATSQRRTETTPPSNFRQWMNFLFGGNVRS